MNSINSTFFAWKQNHKKTTQVIISMVSQKKILQKLRSMSRTKKEEIKHVKVQTEATYRQQVQDVKKIVEWKETLQKVRSNANNQDDDSDGKPHKIIAIKIDALKEMEKLIKKEESPIICSFIGNAGMGKSTFLNLLLGETILPCRDSYEHVTKALIQLSYGEKHSYTIELCDRKELDERLEYCNLTDHGVGVTLLKKDTVNFTDSESLVESLEEMQSNLTENDIYRLKMIKVSIPNDILKDFSLIDSPGLNCGSYCKLFDRLALEACKISDRICIFPNGGRSELPTDLFELTGKIFEDPDVQRDPKPFCFCFGGKNLDPSSNNSFIVDYAKITSTNNLTFSRCLSQFFDIYINEESNLGTENNPPQAEREEIIFVESKQEVIEFLIEEFTQLPIPNMNSDNFDKEFDFSILSFEYMLQKNRMIRMKRLERNLKELALICLPKLMSKIKYQSSKKTKKEMEDIMRTCFDCVQSIVNKFERLKNPFSRYEKKNLILDKLQEGFLVSVLDEFKPLEPTERQASRYSWIETHLKLLEEHIRRLAERNFLYKSSGDSERDWNNFYNAVRPIFDLNDPEHVILASEMKQEILSLFTSCIGNISTQDYQFYSKICELKRDTTKSKALKLPEKDNYENFTEMVSNRIISNSDSAVRKGTYRRDLSNSVILVQAQSQQLPVNMVFLLSMRNVIEIDMKKNNQVVLSNITDAFDNFKVMTSPRILLDNVLTQVAPVFFISLDGNVSELALCEFWKKFTTSSLIVIVSPEDHIYNFLSKVENHNVGNFKFRILSVKVENNLYSLGSLMNAIIHLSTYYGFPLVHIVKEKVKAVKEFFGKEYNTGEYPWTFVRYLRSAEALTIKESNNLKIEEKKIVVSKYIASSRNAVYNYGIHTLENVNGILNTQNIDNGVKNVEQLIDNLKTIDQEIRMTGHESHFEKSFKEEFFSKHMGRVSCWDGMSRVIDKNKIYSKERYNYMVSNYSTGIETYFMPAIYKIMPVADEQFVNDVDLPNNETIQNGFDPKMINFRTNLLAHGVGGFLHFGFKYEVARAPKATVTKRKRNEPSSNSKKKKD